ncbi:MAG: helix-turn-helix domain-containing protein [Planctomycetota bacterium]|nr:helix-turn-helix domain-containing protein [Planctomycetota bacterium]
MSDATFASVLKSARERTGLSQKDLAARIEMTGSYISQLESGARRAPRPKVITRICKALGISERRLQDLAALERSPAPIRRRIERADKERGKIRRTRDRLLVTTLFHMARGPRAIDPLAAMIDLPDEQRMLLGRLVGRARSVPSLEEAERQTEDVLAEAGDQDREVLARVLPGVLAGGPETNARRMVDVYEDVGRTGAPVDALSLDPRLGSLSAYFVRIADDAAHPRVEAGDLLLVDPEREAQAGDTVMMHHEGRDIVRTWHAQGGAVRLDAMRPDLPPVRMAPAAFNGFVVLLLVRALR